MCTEYHDRRGLLLPAVAQGTYLASVWIWHIVTEILGGQDLRTKRGKAIALLMYQSRKWVPKA